MLTLSLLLQSIGSKTNITQLITQRCLCPTHQDAREFHTSVHLKVGELEHIEEVESRNSGGGACSPGPLATAAEPQS